jgi:hypothetical protein
MIWESQMNRKKEFEKILGESESTSKAKENLWKWYALSDQIDSASVASCRELYPVAETFHCSKRIIRRSRHSGNGPMRKRLEYTFDRKTVDEKLHARLVVESARN